MFTFPGETVLDPFLGSGTTSVAAQECQRRSAGYEINRDNARTILDRLGSDPGSLFGSSGVEIISQTDDLVFDCEAAYRTLPYLFKDPVRLERKAEAQARTFGSRVSAQTPKREKYYGVKRVIAANLIELRDGPTVRLLGVTPQAKHRADAERYMRDLLKGQRVYLRFDQIPHDSDGNKLCYVYLSNRTFVNARLIKEGIVGIDDEFPFEKIALFKRYGGRLASAAAIDSGNDS
jgi:site-specific DNA-methyltransferase (adenine-specific)